MMYSLLVPTVAEGAPRLEFRCKHDGLASRVLGIQKNPPTWDDTKPTVKQDANSLPFLGTWALASHRLPGDQVLLDKFEILPASLSVSMKEI